eukprot:6188986-Pleurochrysis_carterae.AAC.2
MENRGARLPAWGCGMITANRLSPAICGSDGLNWPMAATTGHLQKAWRSLGAQKRSTRIKTVNFYLQRKNSSVARAIDERTPQLDVRGESQGSCHPHYRTRSRAVTIR